MIDFYVTPLRKMCEMNIAHNQLRTGRFSYIQPTQQSNLENYMEQFVYVDFDPKNSSLWLLLK